MGVTNLYYSSDAIKRFGLSASQPPFIPFFCGLLKNLLSALLLLATIRIKKGNEQRGKALNWSLFLSYGLDLRMAKLNMFGTDILDVAGDSEE
ncbi:hypothetical protein H6P81_013111 [Aristolochia fimbriata]|uniref:Uncharacterized protein n=1 Tax=Aristolochia fimbriata TaxID=158543 RepID=A0AAV7EE12_ARIFI|nr:hypothetical protein H6P81_013111 [Aristolochia fimbriata]